MGLCVAMLILLPLLLLVGVAGIFLMEPTFTQSANGWRIGLNNPVSPVAFLLFLALAILTPFWVVRVHRNAQALSGAPLKSSPGWAAGAWFIPFAGGVLAAGPMSQIIERSRSTSKGFGMGWGIAWSVYQVMVVVAVIALFASLFGQFFSLGMTPSRAEMETAGADLMQTVRPWQWAMLAFEAVAAALMAFTVASVQAAQTASSRQARPPGNPMMPSAPATPWK